MMALAALVLLNIVDGLLTYHVLSKGGSELNPPMRWLMEKVGVVGALLLTKGVLVVVVWQVGVEALTWAAAGVFLLICLWNTRQLLRQRRK